MPRSRSPVPGFRRWESASAPIKMASGEPVSAPLCHLPNDLPQQIRASLALKCLCLVLYYSQR